MLANVCQVFPQLLVTVIVSVSFLSDGMHFGWSAPILPILRSKDSPIEITRSDETWLEYTFIIGAIIALPPITYLMDTIGRKYCVILAPIISLISWALIGFAGKLEYLYLGRLLSGVGASLTLVSGPTYISEIADKRHRGFLITLLHLILQAGILIIYSLGPFTRYFTPSIVGVTMLALQLLALCFIPETPYFLLSKNKRAEAEAALKQLRKEYHENEFEEIAKAVERQSRDKGNLRNLLLLKNNRKAIIICTMLVACQQWSGYSVVIMNVHSIFSEAESIYISPEFAAIIFGVVMLAILCVSLANIERFGRKKLLVVSGTLSGFSMLTLSIYFVLKAMGIDLANFSYVPIIIALAYAMSVKLGLGFIPMMLPAELFSNNVKSIGLAVVQIFYHLFGLASYYCYQHFVYIGKIEVPFCIFTAIAVISVIYTIYVVPETKGKTLEEIQMTLDRHNR